MIILVLLGKSRGRHTDDVQEEGGEKREEDVKEETTVGLETEDAGGYAEEGGGEGLQVLEGLLHGEGGLVCSERRGGRGGEEGKGMVGGELGDGTGRRGAMGAM